MLSKKYYKAFAAILWQVYEKANKQGPELYSGYKLCWIEIAEALGEFFKADNPRFSAEKFRKAIYGEGEQK